MNERLKQIQNNWNKTADSPWYQSLREADKIQALLDAPSRAFHPAVFAMLQRHFPDLNGKKVLLPSSGDNHAAFALAKLGAEVTSTDISPKQLEYAKSISMAHNLNIRFFCEDTAALSGIKEDSFDLLYTSNGTLSWMDDLPQMYHNMARTMKKGGVLMMFDVHPFTRPFSCAPWEPPRIIKPYSETLPHCHWRMQDIVNAMAAAGLHILEMEEIHSRDASFWFTFDELQTKQMPDLAGINDWHQNPLAALPVWLSIAARK